LRPPPRRRLIVSPDPRGYSAYEGENVFALSGSDGPPDPIEKFSVGSAGNVWPANSPGLEAEVQAFFDDTRAAAKRVFQVGHTHAYIVT
jgi:hypothetical protein